ncbi:hypothetical protein FK268_09480 [Tsukamurella sputi]|uniref:Uncharacterized protein n=1 Tax=Tsukamurella sputi TaxID=2591848 RepID=A0A5C5RN22_9ACTN|nr:hypothetical protein [Tsukamurella sputi]TWS23883.1 hypothetical protein FK268_09480 [Tsukamurella sputi]
MTNTVKSPLARRTREIGRWGTAARTVIGAAFVGAGIIIGPSTIDLIIAVALVPAAITLAVVLRGRDSAPLRVTGAWAMATNTLVFFAFFALTPPAAATFYGLSMLLAASRGLAACEVMAASNVILNRNDQVGCPVFAPIDRIEGFHPRDCA